MVTKIEKNNVEDIVNLTAMQEGLLLYHIGNPRSQQYFDQLIMNISGTLDIGIMKKAWQSVCKNNEVLRSVFRWSNLEKPVQIFLKHKDIPINVLNLVGREDREKLVESAKQEARHRLSLTDNPFSISVCQLTEHQGLLIISAHRILFDGWSNGIILKEFLYIYNQLLEGKQSEFIPKRKYREFIKWYEDQDQEKMVDFWNGYLADFDTKTTLPFSKKVNKNYDSTIYKLVIPGEIGSQIEFYLKENNSTFASFIYAVWGILLQQFSNLDDVVFGTTVSGRPSELKGIESMVGLFFNTVPLRLKFAQNQSILEVLHSVTEQANIRIGNEQCPLALIKNEASVDPKENLFDSIIVIENYPLDRMLNGHGHLQIESYSSLETTNFDLSIQVITLENVQLQFDYNQSVFKENDIKRLGEYWKNLIMLMLNNPLQKISEIDLLAEEEKEKILRVFNNNHLECSDSRVIPYIFEDQVAKWSDNQAIQFAGNSLTYEELNERVNQLAYLLLEEGVSHGDKVVLMFPRSMEIIISMLAILKIGGICTALDMQHPAERINFIIKDCETKFILRAEDVKPDFPANLKDIVYEEARLASYAKVNPGITITEDDLAFIIYTSGSTGNPKGALLNHGGIVSHVFTKIDVFAIDETDIVANNFSQNVIAAIWQIFSPLFRGGKVVVYTDDVETDPYEQFRLAARDQITVMELIPSILTAYLFLLEEGKEKIELAHLKKIGLTSEETKPTLVNKFYREYAIPLVNCYGQTECSDDVLHYQIPFNTQTELVPIGKPAYNTQIFILNHFNQLQPIGAPGEICVSGDSVGIGYWNRPELTDSKFVSNPIFPEKIMYRTGDIGRWLEDGCVEYLGRIDHQVKIRGNRIELREVENHLLRYPGVKNVSVIVQQNRDDEKQLSAFLVANNEITTKEIRTFLSKSLPDYMIPGNFIKLDKFPLTPNGKIDKKELHKIEGSLHIGNEYLAPRNKVEVSIQEIWKDLLGRSKIGVHDNFFDLGGHSLLMIQLKARLEKAFGQEVPIIEMFNLPTISDLAKYITGQKSEILVDKTESERKGINDSSGDIAIIGIAMQVPGAKNSDQFWQNLINKTESITFFREDAAERVNVYEVEDNHPNFIGAGGILGDIDLFDSEFFNISPKEADIMDPQHRVFLEHCWMALEDAGYNPETYPGGIGVFAGAGLNTYLLNNVISNSEIINSLGDFQTNICNDKDFLVTRVSYKLNLKGPGVDVQTACSTSLVAVHLAKQSLLSDDCDMALAGGICIHVPEKTGYVYAEGSIFSPTGHCCPFDEQAKGTVFSNGVGIVVLKRLAAAKRDRDHIYAVIKGSAINNDGRQKVGYTGPSEAGQLKVIKKALVDANLAKESVEYIETHGTGTSLGDPVEFAALTKGYQSDRRQYCALGSVKSNIGHLDAAAGVTGLIKAVLSLHNKMIVPNINFDSPNPLLNFENSPFFIATSPLEWTTDGTRRRAAVSSFGIGGTNAHVILEEAELVQVPPSAKQWYLIVLSARSESAVYRMAANLANFLEKNRGLNLADLAYTLQVGRKRFDYGLAFGCRDIDECLYTLNTLDREHVVAVRKKDIQQQIDLTELTSLDEYSKNVRLGEMWLAGVEIDWEKIYWEEKRVRVPLPTYPFERRRHWIEPKIVQNLTSSAEAAVKNELIEDWFYLPVWKQSFPAGSVGDGYQSSFLLFVDDAGWGMRLADLLIKSNNSVTIVKKGDNYQKIDERTYLIDPCKLEDYITLVQDLKTYNHTVDQVVHLWSLEQTKDINVVDSIREIIDQSVYSLLLLIKGLASQQIFEQLRVWVVSDNIYRIESGDRSNPAKAAISAACKVISQEYPQIICRSIDLGNPGSIYYDQEVVLSLLVEEVNSVTEDHIIAYRNGVRWARFYEHQKFVFSNYSTGLRDRGVYVITGGLGKIGLSIARFLAESVTAKLVLINRSQFPAKEKWPYLDTADTLTCGKVDQLRQMERLGSQILIFQADCGNEKEMHEVFETVEREFGNIDGVIHAAGITDIDSFKVISDLGIEDCEKHFQAKLTGTLVLDRLLANRQYDFCILFSSLASFLGGLGFYAYSLANSFLDGFVDYQKNPRWLSINWGVWKFDDEQHRQSGIRISQLTMEAREGIKALQYALSLVGRVSQVIISPTNVNQQEPVVSQVKPSEISRKLPDYPIKENEKTLVFLWQELLGVESVGINDNFFELGGHSLLATKIVSRIRDIFKIDFSLKYFFEKPTIKDISLKIEDIWGDSELVEEIAKIYNDLE